LLCFVDGSGADSKQVRHVEGTEKSHVGYFRMSPFRMFTYFAVCYYIFFMTKVFYIMSNHELVL